MTGIDRSTLAEMVRRMLERGLLSRERTEKDARANAVAITGSGRKALRAGVRRPIGRKGVARGPAGVGARQIRQAFVDDRLGRRGVSAQRLGKAKHKARRRRRTTS